MVLKRNQTSDLFSQKKDEQGNIFYPYIWSLEFIYIYLFVSKESLSFRVFKLTEEALEMGIGDHLNALAP